MPWWRMVVFNNSLLVWAISGGVFLTVLFALVNAKIFVVRYLRRLNERYPRHLTALVLRLCEGVKYPFLVVLALWCGSIPLALPAKIEYVLRAAGVVTLFLQAAFWGNAVVTYTTAKIAETKKETDPASLTAFGAVAFFAKVALWSLILLLTLDNLGVNITGLIAGLGIGGVAIALATQNILGDIFCSVAILLDKPFEVGDLVVIGEFRGIVEHIGIKTTRLRSLSGEQIVFSNADLIGSRIRNYKRMRERRVLFRIGVTYETPYEKLVKIPQIIREIIDEIPDVRFDRAHFRDYGDFALIFEVVYYVATGDYMLYMDRNQQINLEIFRRFAEEGISFAYPTQTIHLVSENAPAAGQGEAN